MNNNFLEVTIKKAYLARKIHDKSRAELEEKTSIEDTNFLFTKDLKRDKTKGERQC